MNRNIFTIQYIGQSNFKIHKIIKHIKPFLNRIHPVLSGSKSIESVPQQRDGQAGRILIRSNGLRGTLVSPAEFPTISSRHKTHLTFRSSFSLSPTDNIQRSVRIIRRIVHFHPFYLNPLGKSKSGQEYEKQQQYIPHTINIYFSTITYRRVLQHLHVHTLLRLSLQYY